MPAIAFIVGICFLIAIHDLSTAVILFATSFILLFIGRVHLLQLFSVAALMLLVAVLFIFFLKNTPDTNLESAGRLLTWKHRIEGYSNPVKRRWICTKSDRRKSPLHEGNFPNGPGNSKQKNFLPHPYSDYIYAIIIEEYGLLGGFVIILLYLIILFRTIRMVLKAQGLPRFSCVWIVSVNCIPGIYKYGGCRKSTCYRAYPSYGKYGGQLYDFYKHCHGNNS